MVCPLVQKINHSLKLMDYLLVQADKSWYNYYINMVNILYRKETNISKGNKYCRKGDNFITTFSQYFLVSSILAKGGNANKTKTWEFHENQVFSLGQGR